MSLKDYANNQSKQILDSKENWKIRADNAISEFKSFFIPLFKNRIDSANILQAGTRRKLSCEDCNTPLIMILFDRKAAYSSTKPIFFGEINTNHETRNSIDIHVNDQDEADYCAKLITKFLISEGITINNCKPISPGLIFKNRTGGYVIWYSFEW